MKPEYVIWGIPKGQTEEDILHTQSQSMDDAKKVMDIIGRKYGATKMRVQVIRFDGSDIDFVGTVNL